jgi:hypothetical protein
VIYAPISPGVLAELVAAATTELSLAAAASAAPSGVRVGIDGASGADTRRVADLIARAVETLGRPVARVRRDDFVRPRSVRLELGASDEDAGWERWYDDGALRREVLEPLGPGAGSDCAMTWLPALWDIERDRSVRAERRVAAPGTVAVVDGPYLLRWELADAFDLVVHLDVSDAALARRVGAESLARIRGSWRRYVEETAPAERASYVVRYDDPAHPALVTP